jgi:hypothetical protein
MLSLQPACLICISSVHKGRQAVRSLGDTGSLPLVYFPSPTITNIFQNLLDKWGVVSRFPEKQVFCCTSVIMNCTITLAIRGILHDYQSIHLWECMCLRMFLIHPCIEKLCHMKKDTQHFSPYKKKIIFKETIKL